MISLKAHVSAQVQADIFHETKYDHEKLNGIKVYTYLAFFFCPNIKILTELGENCGQTF